MLSLETLLLFWSVNAKALVPPSNCQKYICGEGITETDGGRGGASGSSPKWGPARAAVARANLARRLSAGKAGEGCQIAQSDPMRVYSELSLRSDGRVQRMAFFFLRPAFAGVYKLPCASAFMRMSKD